MLIALALLPAEKAHEGFQVFFTLQFYFKVFIPYSLIPANAT